MQRWTAIYDVGPTLMNPINKYTLLLANHRGELETSSRYTGEAQPTAAILLVARRRACPMNRDSTTAPVRTIIYDAGPMLRQLRDHTPHILHGTSDSSLNSPLGILTHDTV